ncbi:TrbC/VirB2 family protein [Kingella oralis]
MFIFWSITKMVSTNETKHWLKAAALCALLLSMQTAMAAGGFEADITKAATSIQNAIYAVVGVLAAIALLCTFAWGYFGKKHITDVLEVCMWIIGAGASIAAATWLFDIGKGIKF